MTTIGALDYEESDSCVDSKWIIIKLVARQGCNNKPYAVINQIGHVSHHLGSLLGGIELTVLCAFCM